MPILFGKKDMTKKTEIGTGKLKHQSKAKLKNQLKGRKLKNPAKTKKHKGHKKRDMTPRCALRVAPALSFLACSLGSLPPKPPPRLAGRPCRRARGCRSSASSMMRRRRRRRGRAGTTTVQRVCWGSLTTTVDGCAKSMQRTTYGTLEW